MVAGVAGWGAVAGMGGVVEVILGAAVGAGGMVEAKGVGVDLEGVRGVVAGRVVVEGVMVGGGVLPQEQRSHWESPVTMQK